jgi:tetratricopeptide (TPR) repeat protein
LRRKYPKALATPTIDEAQAWQRSEAALCELSEKWFAAAFHLDPLVAADPKDVQLYVRRAMARSQLGQWDKAEADLTAALVFRPDQAALWQKRGMARAALERWQGAGADFTAAIQRHGDGPSVRMQRGNAYMQLRQWARAAEDFAAAIERKTEDATAHVSLGNALATLEQWDRAEAAFRAATKAHKDDVSGWSALALVRWRAGDRADYRRFCQQLLIQFGKTDDPDTANTVAWICVRVPGALADLTAPVKLAEFALRSDPKDPDHLGTLAMVYLRKGQLDLAERHFRHAIEERHGEVSVPDWLGLALTCHGLEKDKEAHQWLAKASAEMRKTDAMKALTWELRLETQYLRQEVEKMLKNN